MRKMLLHSAIAGVMLLAATATPVLAATSPNATDLSSPTNLMAVRDAATNGKMNATSRSGLQQVLGSSGDVLGDKVGSDYLGAAGLSDSVIGDTAGR